MKTVKLRYAALALPMLLALAAQAWAVGPLFQRQAIALGVAGQTMRTAFHVPQQAVYALNLDFEFPSRDGVAHDGVVGARYDMNCNRPYAEIPLASRAGIGRPIPLHVLIRRREDGQAVVDQSYESLCLASSGAVGFMKSRAVAKIALQPGDYTAEFTNLQAQGGLPGVRTFISLSSGRGR